MNNLSIPFKQVIPSRLCILFGISILSILLTNSSSILLILLILPIPTSPSIPVRLDILSRLDIPSGISNDSNDIIPYVKSGYPNWARYPIYPVYQYPSYPTYPN